MSGTSCAVCTSVIPFGKPCWLIALPDRKPAERVVICDACHVEKERAA